MKYRVFALLGLLAFSAGSLIQAQDYDDIYYDASKSESAIKAKVEQQKPKTVAVYGNVPEKYKVAAKDNYRLERDVDEYNRRGNYEPDYEVDINGDTIYFNGDSIYVDAFSNTRMIERFYNPDVVILSDDDDLIELYYDESPTINLIVGNDWNYAPYGWSASYYPWYTGWYEPWYASYHVPYWGYGGWYSPYRYWGWGWDWYYSFWGWPRNPWYWHTGYWGWGHNHWAWLGADTMADTMADGDLTIIMTADTWATTAVLVACVPDWLATAIPMVECQQVRPTAMVASQVMEHLLPTVATWATWARAAVLDMLHHAAATWARGAMVA